MIINPFRFGDLGVNHELILEICGILDVNSFEVPNPSENCSGTVQAVYADAGCLAEHNCVPSAHRTFTSDLALCFRAGIPLTTGDHISITYTDSLWPTAERRSHLMGTKVKLFINKEFSRFNQQSIPKHSLHIVIFIVF